MKLSSKNLTSLPGPEDLRKLCKSISVLDAIFSQEWEYRYFSYNSEWSEGEEFFEMRNGEGDHMLVLFRSEGCVINGFAHEYEACDKQKLTQGLPDYFHEFIFGEPVASIGTTFCLWADKNGRWVTGEQAPKEDGSEELLFMFDGKPETYIEWATEYFEGSYSEDGISVEVVKKVYEGETLTAEMVLNIVDDVEDWEQLEADLKEIGYPCEFE